MVEAIYVYINMIIFLYLHQCTICDLSMIHYSYVFKMNLKQYVQEPSTMIVPEDQSPKLSRLCTAVPVCCCYCAFPGIKPANFSLPASLFLWCLPVYEWTTLNGMVIWVDCLRTEGQRWVKVNYKQVLRNNYLCGSTPASLYRLVQLLQASNTISTSVKLSTHLESQD